MCVISRRNIIKDRSDLLSVTSDLFPDQGPTQIKLSSWSLVNFAKFCPTLHIITPKKEGFRFRKETGDEEYVRVRSGRKGGENQGRQGGSEREAVAWRTREGRERRRRVGVGY